MDTILVVNAGSSSVKFQVFAIEGATGLKRLMKGQMEGIGSAPHLRVTEADGKLAVDRDHARAEVPDLPAALQCVGAWLRGYRDISPIAVGHRVVHGGPDYNGPVQVDDKVLTDLERYIPLAPLHQPNNLAPIRSMLARFPTVPQIACFDTAFHRGHDALADHYAIPRRFHAEGVRRYGFHGLSYEYIASHLRLVAPGIASGRVVVAHLGSGASICALASGRSVESSLGFTALDGLPMGTRPGQLDPGVVVYLLMERGMSAAAVQEFLYHECGLKGLSGISNDVRVLEESVDPNAQFALEYFAYRIGLYAAMMAAALGGLDAFVFTAGIGENSVAMRALVAQRIAWLGVQLDPEANAGGKMLISRGDSRVPIYVIPTDEELMIARHTLSLLSRQGAHRIMATGVGS
jgi:acetate kinase